MEMGGITDSVYSEEPGTDVRTTVFISASPAEINDSANQSTKEEVTQPMKKLGPTDNFTVKHENLDSEMLDAVKKDRTALVDFVVECKDKSNEEKLTALKELRPNMAEESLKDSLSVLAADEVNDQTVVDFVNKVEELEWNDFQASYEDGFDSLVNDNPRLADQKLSKDKLGKLPSSTFCGPNKSYPVTDAVHVTATYRLIKDASVSDVAKARVLATLSRKASALGCELEDGFKDLEDNSTETETDVQDTTALNALSSDQLQALRSAIGDILTKRNAEPEDTKQLQQLENSVKEQTTRANMAEKSLAKLKDQLKDLRRELRSSYDDLEALEDEKINLNQKLRDQLVAAVVDATKLSGGEATEELTDSLNAKSLDELQAELINVNDKLDIDKIADSVNSGLTREPEGTVENPVGVQDNSAKESEETNEIKDKVSVDAFNKKYMELYFTDERQAEIYKQSMIRAGRVELNN